MKKIQIICGPTGSGKTTYALKLADDKPTSIISADSRQAYEGLDILTGKDIPKGAIREQSELSFHNRPVIYYLFPSPNVGEGQGEVYFWGFDLLKPNESFNAAEFSTLTNQIIDREIKSAGLPAVRQVIIVGGSGFYLKALTQPQTLARVLPDEALRQELEKLSLSELQQKLKSLNTPKFLSFNESDVQNPRRLIRALEVLSSPIPLPAAPLQGEALATASEGVLFSWLGLLPSLDILKEKIRTRVILRVQNGALDEVQKLLKNYPDQSLPIYTSLGVKQILQFLNHEINNDQLVDLWTTDEVNYAKRQITWFKKQKSIIWYK